MNEKKVILEETTNDLIETKGNNQNAKLEKKQLDDNIYNLKKSISEAEGKLKGIKNNIRINFIFFFFIFFNFFS